MAKQPTAAEVLCRASEVWSKRITALTQQPGGTTREAVERVAAGVAKQFRTGDKKIDSVVGGYLRDSAMLLNDKTRKRESKDAGPENPAVAKLIGRADELIAEKKRGLTNQPGGATPEQVEAVITDVIADLLTGNKAVDEQLLTYGRLRVLDLRAPSTGKGKPGQQRGTR